MPGPDRPPEGDDFRRSLLSAFGSTIGRTVALALIACVVVAILALVYDVSFKAALLACVGVVVVIAVAGAFFDGL